MMWLPDPGVTGSSRFCFGASDPELAVSIHFVLRDLSGRGESGDAARSNDQHPCRRRGVRRSESPCAVSGRLAPLGGRPQCRSLGRVTRSAGSCATIRATAGTSRPVHGGSGTRHLGDRGSRVDRRCRHCAFQETPRRIAPIRSPAAFIRESGAIRVRKIAHATDYVFELSVTDRDSQVVIAQTVELTDLPGIQVSANDFGAGSEPANAIDNKDYAGGQFLGPLLTTAASQTRIGWSLILVPTTTSRASRCGESRTIRIGWVSITSSTCRPRRIMGNGPSSVPATFRITLTPTPRQDVQLRTAPSRWPDIWLRSRRRFALVLSRRDQRARQRRSRAVYNRVYRCGTFRPSDQPLAKARPEENNNELG